MLKQLLEALTNVLVSLIAAGILLVVFDNQLRLEHIWPICGVLILTQLLIAWVSKRKLPWNWRWHRFWYLWELKGNPELRQWEKDFAQLDLTRAQISKLGVKVITANSPPQELIKVLRDVIAKQRESGNRALVLGEPGSGKTTGLQRLTLELARDGERRFGFGQVMPVFVDLGHFQEGKLLEYVGQAMCSRGASGKILGTKIKELVEQGRVVLLLDGLDEALGERRGAVLAELALFLSNRGYERVPVVITTRTHSDPGERLPGLQLFKIQELNDEAVELFIQAYKQAEHREQKIRQQLKRHGLLKPGRLGRNPFWLRLIVQNDGFQGNKSQILNNAVDELLRRESNKPETRPARLRELPWNEQLAETKRALAWLAYQMSARQLVVLEKRNAQAELKKWLENSHVEGLKASDILKLGRDAQLLVYEPNPIQFRHRLLQEFMAAWALAKKVPLVQSQLPSDWWQTFLEQSTPDTDWWGESFLMLASLVENHTVLVQDVLGDGSNDQRLFLAMVLLRVVENPDEGVTREVTAALVKSLLRRGVTQQHKQAATKLAQIAGDNVVEALGKLLQQKNPTVKKATIEILGEIGDNNAAKVLTSHLGNEMLAGVVVERLKSIGEPAVEPLIMTLGNDKVRKTATLALERIGEVAVPPLITRLKNGKQQMREGAASALGQIRDQRAVQPLIMALQDENEPVRWAAASALGQIGDRRAVPPLIAALQDEKSRVSQAAARALGPIGDQQAVPQLIRALKQHQKQQVRAAAAKALGQIEDQRAVNPLTAALQDKDERVHQMATEALEKMAL